MGQLGTLRFLDEMDATQSESIRISMAEKYLGRIVNNILNLSKIGKDDNLQDLGLNSMKNVELKSKMQELIEDRVTIGPPDLVSCYTVAQFAKRLVEILYEDKGKRDMKLYKERIQLMFEDCQLPEHIQISKSCTPATPVDQVRTVFLTGTTGNMGPYYVQQLSQLKQIQKIICLVRPNKDISADDRLIIRLKHLELWEDTDWTKVKCVEGDITLDLLGLGATVFEQLAEEVEAIVHVAVMASHLELYGKGSSHRYGVRAVNVEGMLRILEFAAKTRVKSILNLSTVGAVWIKKRDVPLMIKSPDEWPRHGEFDEAPNFGYAISKYIQENLCGQAVKRGIPIKIYRLPKVFGATKNGRFDVKDNHFVLKFLYFVKAGMMPDAPVPLQVLPVDTCTELSIQLFFNPETPNEICNMISPQVSREPETISRLTYEYGPMLRIADYMWRAKDEFKEGIQTGNWDNFYETTFESSARDGMNLAPLISYFKKELISHPHLVGNPAAIFQDEKLREFLSTEYGYPMRVIPFLEFAKHLQSDDNGSWLHTFLDFYVRPDPLYVTLPRVQFSGRSIAVRDFAKFSRNTTAKLRKFIPNAEELIDHPLTCVRLSFEYMLANAMTVLDGVYEDIM